MIPIVWPDKADPDYDRKRAIAVRMLDAQIRAGWWLCGFMAVSLAGYALFGIWLITSG